MRNKAKAPKPVSNKLDNLNEITLKKAENRAIVLLEELKSIPDFRTRPVRAKEFGFNSSLVMLVDPNISDEQIIEKFKKRLNTDFGWFTDKLKQRV